MQATNSNWSCWTNRRDHLAGSANICTRTSMYDIHETCLLLFVCMYVSEMRVRCDFKKNPSVEVIYSHAVHPLRRPRRMNMHFSGKDLEKGLIEISLISIYSDGMRSSPCTPSSLHRSALFEQHLFLGAVIN